MGCDNRSINKIIDTINESQNIVKSSDESLLVVFPLRRRRWWIDSCNYY